MSRACGGAPGGLVNAVWMLAAPDVAAVARTSDGASAIQSAARDAVGVALVSGVVAVVAAGVPVPTVVPVPVVAPAP